MNNTSFLKGLGQSCVINKLVGHAGCVQIVDEDDVSQRPKKNNFVEFQQTFPTISIRQSQFSLVSISLEGKNKSSQWKQCRQIVRIHKCQWFRMSTKAWVVDRSFNAPNWGSSSLSSIIQRILPSSIYEWFKNLPISSGQWDMSQVWFNGPGWVYFRYWVSQSAIRHVTHCSDCDEGHWPAGWQIGVLLDEEEHQQMAW